MRFGRDSLIFGVILVIIGGAIGSDLGQEGAELRQNQDLEINPTNSESTQDKEEQRVLIINKQHIENAAGILTRMNRFLPNFVFNKVVPQHACQSDGLFGTCLTAKECRQRNGQSIASCAQGYGSCCLLQKSCSDERNGEVLIRDNSTLIGIPSIVPNPNPTCQFVLPKPKGICQVKLDFMEFDVGVSKAGNCEDDFITISGASNLEGQPLKLCGNLKDQHLYLTYGAAPNRITIDSSLATATANYSIRVTQIRCNSLLSVPEQCTQYYTGNTGTVRSLNYPQQQLNNQRYTVCVRQEESLQAQAQSVSQKIQWKACNEPGSFLVSGEEGDIPVNNPEDCTTDFVQIFGTNRQCGSNFRPFETLAKPFLMRVNFDMMEDSKIGQFIRGLDEKSCPGQSSGVTDCHWDIGAEQCYCVFVNQGVLADKGNSGFCLEYTQVE